MSYWSVIPAALSAAGAISSYKSGKAQSNNQRAWNEYNAVMNYDTAMDNIDSQMALLGFNAQLMKSAGEIDQKVLSETAEFNVATVLSVAAYNGSLLDREQELMWEGMDLDLRILREERARERGDIIAAQSVSGTVIGEGSNADAIIDQMGQENMDALVIRHGADIQASRIQNAKLMNNFNAYTEAQKIMWEAQTGSYVSEANSNLRIAGMLTEGSISSMAARKTASNSLVAGMQGAGMQDNMNNLQLSNQLVNGLFSSGAQAVSSYYANKVPNTPKAGVPSDTSSSAGSSMIYW